MATTPGATARATSTGAETGPGPGPGSGGGGPRKRRGRRVLAAVLGLALVGGVGAVVVDALPPNPFEQRTVDRSTTPLLVALREVSEYRAATGTFQVLVDVENDTPYVPSVISGERTTLFATGTVDAVVDFSSLGPERVVVSEDRRTATITLPAPVLAPAVVDPAQSRIVNRERGLAERLDGALSDNPTDDGPLYALAAERIDESARNADLVGTAEESTRRMLTALTGSLGYEQVTVVFESRP